MQINKTFFRLTGEEMIINLGEEMIIDTLCISFIIVIIGLTRPNFISYVMISGIFSVDA